MRDLEDRHAFLLPAFVTLGLLSALGLGGCDERAAIFDRPLEVQGPVDAAGQLVFLVRTTGQVLALDPEGGLVAHPVGPRPRALTITPTGVAVIAGRGDAPVLDRVALPGGERTRLALPAPYDRIWISPAGTHALLTFDPTAPQAPGAVPARNNNEVAVVDLASNTVSPLLLQTESLAPKEVLFADDGSLAAVLLDSAVALIDLGTSPPEVVTVPLRLGDGSLLTPKQGLFAPDGGHLFLQVHGSPDVLALEIERSGPFGAAVNFLFSPDAISLQDITRVEGYPDHIAALFWRPTGSVIALLEASGDTSRAQSVDLRDRPTRLYDLGTGHLLACAAAARGSGTFSRYVAAYSLETGRVDEDALLGTTLDLPRVGGGRAFFTHGEVSVDGQTARGALTVLRVDEDALRLRIRLSPVVLGGAGSLAPTTLPDGAILAAVRTPREDSGAPPDLDGQAYPPVAFLLTVGADGQPGDAVVLDDAVDQIGVAGDFAWAMHPSAIGDLTLLPLADLRRETARRYRGFFFTGLSEAEELSR